MPGLTVIIATYDRATLLRGTLEAVARQHDPGVPVAVLVADNGSNDETREVVAQVAPTRPDFEWRYLHEPRPGKSYAVNTALRHARGHWLVFTDDDVCPDAGWLCAIAGAFRKSDPDFVVGRIQPTWETSPPSWLTPALYGVLGVPDNGTVPRDIAMDRNEHIMPIGTNMAVQSRTVVRVGGLRPDLGKVRGTLRTGEDHEFYLRLLHAGCRGVYAPDALVHHFVPAERLSRPYFRRWYWQNGRNVAQLERAFPPRTPMLLGVPRYKWRQAAADAARFLLSTARFDAPARLRYGLAVWWFAGYLRERWLAANHYGYGVAVQPLAAGHSREPGVSA